MKLKIVQKLSIAVYIAQSNLLEEMDWNYIIQDSYLWPWPESAD